MGDVDSALPETVTTNVLINALMYMKRDSVEDTLTYDIHSVLVIRDTGYGYWLNPGHPHGGGKSV
jgi:hypothetical protein